MSLSFYNTIFSMTATTLVETMSSVDYSNLVPVTGLVDAKYCRPCHLVVKRNKKHFWNRVKILPTPFKLSDILRDEDADNLNWDSLHCPPNDIVSVNRSLTFKAKGKLKATLPHGLVTMEMEGGNSVTISVNLGDIVENSIDVPSLVNGVKSRKINHSHDFIREAMSNRRNSLCLVVTSLNTKSEVEITAENKAQGGANLEVTAGVSKTVDVGGKVLSESQRCLQIPADTAIAFRMHDLLIKTDQTIQLLLLPDSKGGFQGKNLMSMGRRASPYLGCGGAERSSCASPERVLLTEIKEGMKAIFDLPDYRLSITRASLFELMTTPLALDKLNVVLQSTVNLLLIGDKSSKVSGDALDEMLGRVGLNASKALLKVAGFSFAELEVTYPDSDRGGVLSCLADLVDVMSDLSEDQCRKLLQCSETERSILMEMLEGSLTVDPLLLDQTRVISLIEEFPRVESLLLSVGLHRERMDGNWYLCKGIQEKDESVTPGEMLAMVFALWGE